MKIAILYSTVAFGEHRTPFDFSDLEGGKDGLTGTDLVCLSYARELAARGHAVTLYCHGVGDATQYDGVVVRNFKFWGDQGYRDGKQDWDAVIATSNPNALQDADPRALRIVNRQVSTFGIDTFEYETHGYDKFVDLYLTPSETARAYVTKDLPREIAAKFRVLPNGCYPEQFNTNIARVPGRVVYTSSPDRGLHLLLQVWPGIRARVPHAELRIYYQSLDSWIAFHCSPAKRFGGPLDHECTRRALYVRHALRRLDHHGVQRVGGVSHRQLVRELSEAECFAYPCQPLAFTETFSVATLEACAAGAVPIISSADCLEEVHGVAAGVVRHPVQERMQEFSDRVVRALTEPAFRREFAQLGRKHAGAHDWRVLARTLEGMILEGIKKKKAAIPAHHPATSTERPVIDLVLTRYGSGDEPIDIEHPFDSNGGGGCRGGFMGLARELPGFGYRVRAFSTYRGLGGPGTAHYQEQEGVEYRDIGGFRTDNPYAATRPDVIVAYYDTSPLVGMTGCLRVASHHTFAIPCPGAFEWTDVNLAPSQYAVDALRPVFDRRAPWYVMPNAVQPDLPRWSPVPGRCIYHTSPSRGLHHLLEAWPEVRRQIPGATLHIVGDIAGWLAGYDGVPNRQGLVAARVHRALVALGKSSGVRLLGKLSRQEVLRELSEAGCFPFTFDAPAGPCETFSVAMMESIAIGIPCIYFDGDALGSIYGTNAIASSVGEEFVTDLVQVLGTTPITDHNTINWARSFTFKETAGALDRAIRANLPSRVEVQS